MPKLYRIGDWTYEKNSYEIRIEKSDRFDMEKIDDSDVKLFAIFSCRMSDNRNRLVWRLQFGFRVPMYKFKSSITIYFI